MDIKRKASFPHLARGDSYQTTQDSEDRISRPLIQRAGTSEYLKELNRSKSQDREAINLMLKVYLTVKETVHTILFQKTISMLL